MKPTAAKGKFPYHHRNMAQWQYRPEKRLSMPNRPVLWAINGLGRWDRFGSVDDLPPL